MEMYKDSKITREDAFKPEERFKSGKRKVRPITVDDKDIQTRLAHHLRAARIKRGVSQEDAASIFFVGVKTWQRYENGERDIPSTLLFQVFSNWGIDPTDFFMSAECEVYVRGTKVPQKERISRR